MVHNAPDLSVFGFSPVMITYQNASSSKRFWMLVPVVGVLLGVGVWWWQGRQVVPPEVVDAAPEKPGIIKELPVMQPLDTLPPATLSGDRPADFTGEEWAALKEAMSRTDNPEKELERVVTYLRFQRGFEQWQSLQDSPDVAARRRLAERLFERVPERLRQGELSMGEAVLIQAALLNDIESNEQVRQQRLKEAQKALTDAAPRPDSDEQAREAALLAEYKRREAAILADYKSRPESQRDYARLEEALESARRAVYAGQ